MRRCPHCHLPLEAPGTAAETELAVRRLLEAKLAVPVQPDAYILQDALRLIGNEDATIEEIGQALDAWSDGKRPADVKRLKMFQAKTWPRTRAACLGEAPTETLTQAQRIFNDE